MKKKIIKSLSFVLIGMMLFGYVQEVFTPDWHIEGASPDYMISGLEALPDNTIDIIFLGSSAIYNGVSPMHIYENTGICSYNLSLASQTIELEYYNLKQVFNHQNPTIVFFNVNDLFSANAGATPWRYMADNLPLSIYKIELANVFNKLYPKEQGASILFPFIKYHSRWDELTVDDFIDKKSKGIYYSAGQLVEGRVQATTLQLEIKDWVVDEMKKLNNVGTIAYYDNSQFVEIDLKQAGPSLSTISEKNINWLKEIKNLCDDHNVTLVLLKVPGRTWPQNDMRSWNRDLYFETKKIATELNIDYLDLEYEADLIDFTTDTIDSGRHLNVRGADKVTAYIEDYIINNFEIQNNRNAQYDEMLKKYQKVHEIAILQSETNMNEYFRLLNENKDKWSIMLSAKSEYAAYIEHYGAEHYRELGLNLLQEGEGGDAYLAFIDNGKVVYEAVSNRDISYTNFISENIPIILYSAGYLNTSNSFIKINGIEYSAQKNGLNIVVFDKESGLIIDSSYCNTQQANQRVSHIGAFTKLRNYEEAICFN